MTRKRASLAGRGVEILFGEEPEDSESTSAGETSTVEDETVDPDQPVDSAEASEEPTGATERSEDPAEDAESMDPAWVAMLEAEAEASTKELEADTEPPDEEEAPAPVADVQPDEAGVEAEEVAPVEETDESLPELATAPAQPEEQDLPELATTPAGSTEDLPDLATTPAGATSGLPVEESSDTSGVTPMGEAETMAAESPSTIGGAVYEPETPPSPMYTEPPADVSEPTAPLPPPKEKPEAFDPVVRARLQGALYETVTEAPPEERLLPDGPRSEEFELTDLEEYEVGQPSRTRSEREILDYVGLKQRQLLWKEITELYSEVPEVLCMDKMQDEALNLLYDAQDILMETPRQFDVAQYKVGQVRSIVTRRKNITRWTNTYGWGTFIYEVVWIILLGAAILFAPAVVSWIESQIGDAPSFISVADLWNTAAWGSIGGVLGALYSLYWHAAQVKDFHKQYLMWYIVQPVIGVIIGAVVYVITGAGFIGATGETLQGDQTVLPLFRYAVACIASFRQRFILEVVDRIIQFLTSPFQAEEKPPPEGKPSELVSAPEE